MNRQVKQCTYDCKFFSERGRGKREKGWRMKWAEIKRFYCCVVTLQGMKKIAYKMLWEERGERRERKSGEKQRNNQGNSLFPVNNIIITVIVTQLQSLSSCLSPSSSIAFFHPFSLLLPLLPSFPRSPHPFLSAWIFHSREIPCWEKNEVFQMKQKERKKERETEKKDISNQKCRIDTWSNGKRVQQSTGCVLLLHFLHFFHFLIFHSPCLSILPFFSLPLQFFFHLFLFLFSSFFPSVIIDIQVEWMVKEEQSRYFASSPRFTDWNHSNIQLNVHSQQIYILVSSLLPSISFFSLLSLSSSSFFTKSHIFSLPPPPFYLPFVNIMMMMMAMVRMVKQQQHPESEITSGLK